MKSSSWISVIAFGAALFAISCGGGGGKGTQTFSATTRSVQNIQRLSAMSMAKSGIAMAPFFLGGGGLSGGTTGSTTGGSVGIGGGISGIGFFFRGFVSPAGLPARMARSRTLADESGTTGSGGGNGEDFYYDEWLQLWVWAEWNENVYSSRFYQDEAKTLTAGHSSSTFTGTLDSFPQSYASEYELTAGIWAGAHGSFISTQSSWSDGNMVYDNVYSDGSHDHGQSEWNSVDSSWSSRWEGPSGTIWYEDSGEWHSDGSGVYNCSNSDGWAIAWNYNADWSGTAHITGPDPLLPADMTWTSDGQYRILYADGSVEEWSWDEYWDNESGTSGTTGTAGMSPRAEPANLHRR
jgi:hypothetical protein